MSQATTLAINDGAAVPRSFVPVAMPNMVTGYEFRGSGVIATFPVCSVSIRRPRPGVRNPVYRTLLRTKVVEPQVVGIAASGIQPPVQAQSVGWNNNEYVIPSSFSAALRADLFAFSTGFAIKPEVKAAVVDMDQPMA